jgi:hypothetical protein
LHGKSASLSRDYQLAPSTGDFALKSRPTIRGPQRAKARTPRISARYLRKSRFVMSSPAACLTLVALSNWGKSAPSPTKQTLFEEGAANAVSQAGEYVPLGGHFGSIALLGGRLRLANMET